jgi:hypothetical protein
VIAYDIISADFALVNGVPEDDTVLAGGDLDGDTFADLILGDPNTGVYHVWEVNNTLNPDTQTYELIDERMLFNDPEQTAAGFTVRGIATQDVLCQGQHGSLANATVEYDSISEFQSLTLANGNPVNTPDWTARA